MEPAPPSSEKMGITMSIVAWGLLFLILALFFNDWLDERHNPNQAPLSTINGTIKEVVLQPNRQHHYVTSGSINNHEVVFLLDTGATDVVIPLKLAQRIGLKQGRRQLANTANGTISVFSTQLQSVRIGAIELEKITASINPAMAGDVVLLGMSALRQIEFSQRGDTLVLRQ